MPLHLIWENCSAIWSALNDLVNKDSQNMATIVQIIIPQIKVRI